jgi:hypothetical protein
MYARMQAATTARVTAVRHLPIPLTGRFITHLSMGAFARRHCPPGMRWCPRSAHYVAASAMCTTNVSYRHWCQVCVNLLWPKRRAEQRLRLRREKQALQAEYDALAHERELLRKEIRELRNLKALLDREMLKRPEPPPTADLLQALLQPKEAPTRPLPSRRPRDRRKSFSM